MPAQQNMAPVHQNKAPVQWNVVQQNELGGLIIYWSEGWKDWIEDGGGVEGLLGCTQGRTCSV